MLHFLESLQVIRETKPDKLSHSVVIDEVIVIFGIELYPGVRPFSHFWRNSVCLHRLPDRLWDSLSVKSSGSGRQESRDGIQCGHFLTVEPFCVCRLPGYPNTSLICFALCPAKWRPNTSF